MQDVERQGQVFNRDFRPLEHQIIVYLPAELWAHKEDVYQVFDGRNRRDIAAIVAQK